MEDLALLLRRLLGRHDASSALERERREIAAALAEPADARLEEEQRRLRAHARDALRIGESAGGDDFLVALPDLLSHLWLLGASGSGKTYLLLYLLLVLWWRLGVAIVCVDGKGEMRELLLETLLPALLARLPRREAEKLAASVRVVDPFAATSLPPMNVLVRDPSIPVEIQATDVASSVVSAVDAGTGLRIDNILHWTLRLAIQAQGTFLSVRRGLQEGAVLDGLVRLVGDPEVTSYFLQRFPSEPQASKLALLARLDRLLALPATRACLSAPSCLDFGAMLDSGFTIIDLGRAPAGAREIADFWATLIGTRLFRAVNCRPPAGTAPPAVVAMDEWQNLLTPHIAADIENQLALARSRRVSLWLANQQVAQLKTGGSLREIVSGQTAVQVMFRSTIDDARAMRHMLPVTGREPRPKPPPWERRNQAPYLAPAEELELRVREVSQLPQRHAYWWDRRKPWSAVRFRSATVDLGDPARLDHDLRDAIRQGSVAVPAADLQRAIEAERRRLDRLARTGLPAPAPKPAVRPGSAPTSKPRKGRKRGKLPW